MIQLSQSLFVLPRHRVNIEAEVGAQRQCVRIRQLLLQIIFFRKTFLRLKNSESFQQPNKTERRYALERNLSKKIKSILKTFPAGVLNVSSNS